MAQMERFFYTRIEHNILQRLLRNREISSALAYMLDYSKHSNLEVIPKEHSIEISNDDITISVIIFVGFEGKEYEQVKNRKNLHLVSFSSVVPEMVEFRNLNVKYIDNLALLFTTLACSEEPLAKELFSLKNLGDV